MSFAFLLPAVTQPGTIKCPPCPCPGLEVWLRGTGAALLERHHVRSSCPLNAILFDQNDMRGRQVQCGEDASSTYVELAIHFPCEVALTTLSLKRHPILLYFRPAQFRSPTVSQWQGTMPFAFHFCSSRPRDVRREIPVVTWELA